MKSEDNLIGTKSLESTMKEFTELDTYHQLPKYTFSNAGK
jgi:hypothetical protein